ncbi:hypothetical protein MKW92_015185 [Papaver armeniacum]|nr:hypothetical protein MKW92_015185 [Papaver armeniacum]
MGHLIPFLHISNKLAEKGHKISYLCPTKTISKLEPLNLYPNLITFVPLDVPHIDGLPVGAETMSDVSPCDGHFLLLAFFRLQKHVESILIDISPNLIFFDVAVWIPSFARKNGIKSVSQISASAACVAYVFVPSRNILNDDDETRQRMMKPPSDFPPISALKLHSYEVHTAIPFWAHKNEHTQGLSMHQLLVAAVNECDIISLRTYREIEGPYCDYLENIYKKPFLQTGLVFPTRNHLSTKTHQPLEERWENWLGGFKTGSVIYCAFGSELVLSKDQFQELVLGFELTGMLFFVALKPPAGFEMVDDVLPEGFKDRVQGRGLVHGGWVQQPQILAHNSVGCFVSHCGFGSMCESLFNDVQVVMMPHQIEHCLNARLEWNESESWFSKNSICSAIKKVMDEDSKIGAELKKNHSKLRESLTEQGLESSYVDNFINTLQEVVF